MVKLNVYSDSLDVKLISLRRQSSSSETSSPGQSPSTLQEGSCSSKSESYDDRNDMVMKIKKSFNGRNFNGLITWSKLKSLKLDFLTNVSPSPWLLQLGCGRQWNSGLSDNRLMRHCSLKNQHCWPENQHCWCENGGISPKFVSPPATLNTTWSNKSFQFQNFLYKFGPHKSSYKGGMSFSNQNNVKVSLKLKVGSWLGVTKEIAWGLQQRTARAMKSASLQFSRIFSWASSWASREEKLLCTWWKGLNADDWVILIFNSCSHNSAFRSKSGEEDE